MNSLTLPKKKYRISELVQQAYQFANELTRNPPQYTFDELVEIFKPRGRRNREQNREVWIFDDGSCLEFLHGSTTFYAHDAKDLEKVLANTHRQNSGLILPH